MFDKLVNKINTIKEESKNLTEQLDKSEVLINLTPLPDISKIPITKDTEQIISMCPDLNNEKAIIISKVIPVEETYLDIFYIKEIITNIDYWLVLTNKYIWFINDKSYGILPYQNIKECNIIKNNLMSKSININKIIFEINGNENKINNIISLLTNNEYRNKKIEEKTNYLCGITPIFQLINNIKSGISVDNNNNIVFHSSTENYKTTPNDITNYEVLVDNASILSKNQERNTSINSFTTGCYSISLRITTKTKTLLIPILEQNSLGKKYNIHDSTYEKNINFAKQIINKLNELCDINY
ncbi:MAG: hypothetical protein VZS44_08990 [Bacilli bacterium]|nr:hypothetical protein [Bacilli bacterium]